MEIKQLKADIAALIDTQVSRAIPSVRQVLTTYKEQLVAHECDIGPKLQTQVTSCFLVWLFIKYLVYLVKHGPSVLHICCQQLLFIGTGKSSNFSAF